MPLLAFVAGAARLGRTTDRTRREHSRAPGQRAAQRLLGDHGAAYVRCTPTCVHIRPTKLLSVQLSYPRAYGRILSHACIACCVCPCRPCQCHAIASSRRLRSARRPSPPGQSAGQQHLQVSRNETSSRQKKKPESPFPWDCSSVAGLLDRQLRVKKGHSSASAPAPRAAVFLSFFPEF